MSQYANQGNKSGIVIAVIVIIVLAVGGGWYFFSYQPAQEAKEKAIQEQIAKEKAEQQRKEQAIQRKAKYDQLIIDADAAFQQEDWGTAQALYSEASSLFTSEQYPQSQLAIVNAKLDELASLEANRAAGIIESISTRTGRYYVIVSSSVDDDLAMDYASELSKEGNNVKIIEHDDGKHLFYRVSLGDYDTWDQAVSASTSLTDFGDGVWVLPY